MKQCNNVTMKPGFTMFEVLLVIAAVVIITAFTIPTGINFMNSQTLDETRVEIIAGLRRAQSQSVFQKNDSDFGVKFLSDSYVLFQGSSYSGRTQSEDEVFDLTPGIAVSGVDEVVFSKLFGIPNNTGTTTIFFVGENRYININNAGKIE